MRRRRRRASNFFHCNTFYRRMQAFPRRQLKNVFCLPRQKTFFRTMCSAAAERDVPCGRDVWLRQVMCAFGTSRRNTSHHCVPPGAPINRACRGLWGLGVGSNITAADAATSLARQGKHHFFRTFGPAFVLLAPICDKKSTEVRNDPCLSRFL